MNGHICTVAPQDTYGVGIGVRCPLCGTLLFRLLGNDLIFAAKHRGDQNHLLRVRLADLFALCQNMDQTGSPPTVDLHAS